MGGIMKVKMSLWFGLLILGMMTLSCGSESSADPDRVDIGKNEASSPCGGFPEDNTARSLSEDSPQKGQYELLIWNYDASTKTVTFLCKYVCGNCAWRYSIGIFREGPGIYTIEETEHRPGNPATCVCIYDLMAELPNAGTSEESLKIRLLRHRSDEEVLYDGIISLSDGQGEIQVKENDFYCIQY
jgi:hypothetical protein